MGEGLQQPLNPESCAQLFIIILTLQRTPLSLVQLHCRNEKHLGSQQRLNSSSKKDQDSSTKTRRDRWARPHPGHILPFAWPQASPTHPLTVHPADADHFKHGKEQQARATAGVIIKQLEDVHPALWGKRQSEPSAGGQGTCPSPHEMTGAHLGGHPARSREFIPCSQKEFAPPVPDSQPPCPHLTTSLTSARTPGTVVHVHRAVYPASHLPEVAELRPPHSECAPLPAPGLKKSNGQFSGKEPYPPRGWLVAEGNPEAAQSCL